MSFDRPSSSSPLTGQKSKCQRHSKRSKKSDKQCDKKKQSKGTVRSIPIKNYRASLLQNIETLNRPVVPQMQFESFVSEPERPIRSYNNRKGCLTVSSYQKNDNYYENNKKKQLKNKKQSKESSKKYSEFIPKFRFLEEPHNFTRTNNYCQDSFDNSQEHMNNYKKNNKNSEHERSNVLQKISVYESNARASGRSSELVRLSNSDRKNRTLGVPLVGMHNACGLPIIGYSWPEKNITRLCLTGEFAGRLETHQGTYEKQRKKIKKRRAPQPGDDDNRMASRRTITSIDSSGRNKILKRPSFKNSRINSLSFKQRSYRRIESGKDDRIFGSLRRRSFARRSIKRATLYAKDDGSEAVDVLTTLCLNPMARNKGAINMIW